MKNIIFFILLVSCSAPEARKTYNFEADDQKILDALHEEPMRMGTKKVMKEGMMTTEVWTYNQEHGSNNVVTETLLHKNGKLVSHTMTDSASGHSFSRQYKDGKVIEASETIGEKTSTLFLDQNEKIRGRLNTDDDGAECFIYTDGKNPMKEKPEVCEREFNTAP